MPRCPRALALSDARRIWLHAQRLDVVKPFGAGAEATRQAVEHLGYVQIDTINVIERCHHHILYSRIPGYRREDLHQALSVQKSIFEYWTHALAYVPTRDIRFFLGEMKRRRDHPSPWFKSVKPAELKKVMALLRDGPLTIRDIEDDVLVEKDHAWGSRKPSKRALQLGFFSGLATISERQGMLKTYDLMERHFGWEKRPRLASERQVLDYRLDRALRAQGVVSLDSVCHLEAALKPAIRAVIDGRVRRKALVPVAVEGADKTEHWATPQVLEAAYPPSDQVHILSPFDPLIIQRKRLSMMFGYDHLFEAYVPKEKRRLGYFALPVLVGDQIVAALDLKADRQARELLIQKWTWVGNGTAKDHNAAIEEALGRFQAFQFAD